MASEPVRTYPSELPVIPLRQTVVFPLTLQPLAINRALSIESVNRALVSALRSQAVREDVAMTGEITLTGLVLPVGGIREKALAARRHGIKTLILPADNVRDLAELPPEVRNGMTFIPAETLLDVLKVALPQN